MTRTNRLTKILSVTLASAALGAAMAVPAEAKWHDLYAPAASSDGLISEIGFPAS